MCFTAAARGGGSLEPEPCDWIAAKSKSAPHRLLILSWMIKVQKTTQLAVKDYNANNTVVLFDFYTQERFGVLPEAFHLITRLWKK